MDMLQKKAKMETLKALKKMAMKMIHNRCDEESPEMSKVTVAAADKEGLQAGLDKAEDVLGEMPEMEDDKLEDESDLDLLASEESPEDEEAMLLARLEELRAKKRMA